MKKRIIALFLTLAFIIGAFSSFVVMTGAEESTPEMTIAYCNLSFRDTVCIKYAVKSNVSNVKILVWTAPEAEYIVGTQDDEITTYYTDNIYGESHMIFDYTKLNAKQMTDVIYVRAYAKADGVDYYSEVNKYSILQYAYNMLGKTATASDNTELRDMLEHMLEYGAAAQKYLDDYKVDRLATADWYQVKVTAGLLDDGCTHGLYLPNDTVTMTAPATNAQGAAFVGWKDSRENVVSNDRVFELTVKTKNEVYTPFYESEEPEEEPTYPWAEVPSTLKVLAIGNSFSVDAMEYLYQIAEDAGVENIVLGNLRVSGCTLDMHYDYVVNGTDAYTYYKNITGAWTSTTGSTLLDGLKDEDWDIITLQQGSPESGLVEKYSNLENLAKYVKNNATNSNVKLYWHMTWAYQADSTHSAFPTYNSNQMTMYNMIVDAVQEKVLTLDMFEGVIPSGTAVQNARTSFLGDTITRDGYHMAQPMGRYLVGLTYFAALTGADIADITYTPSETASPELLAMFKESVTNAMNNKFEVTQSTYTEGSAEIVPEPKTDAELAAEIGVDLSGYTLLEYEYLENQYYMCDSRIDAKTASSGQNGKHICTAERYSISQLLNAVIICDDGWQYRPELWLNATDVATKRPNLTTERITLLDMKWWGSNTVFAFNVSANPQRDISSDYSEAAKHVRIYVPNTTVYQQDAIFAATIGIDLSKYEHLEYEYRENSYYNCKNGITQGKPSDNQSEKHISTATRYTKEELLNAIIICDTEWQYRPELWPDETNTATIRPDLVKNASINLLDEDWWGSNTVFAFNVSRVDGAKISADYSEAATHVRVYIPKKT